MRPQKGQIAAFTPAADPAPAQGFFFYRKALKASLPQVVFLAYNVQIWYNMHKRISKNQ